MNHSLIKEWIWRGNGGCKNKKASLKYSTPEFEGRQILLSSISGEAKGSVSISSTRWGKLSFINEGILQQWPSIKSSTLASLQMLLDRWWEMLRLKSLHYWLEIFSFIFTICSEKCKGNLKILYYPIEIGTLRVTWSSFLITILNWDPKNCKNHYIMSRFLNLFWNGNPNLESYHI